MTGAGVDPQCNLGTLCAPPRAGHGSDTGVGDPTPTAMSQV